MQDRPPWAPRRFQQLSLLADASVVAACADRCLRGWCLAVTGEQALSWWGPLVVEAVSARYASNARTAEKAAAEAYRLFRYLDARGAAVWADVTAGLVLDWCWAARRDRSGVHRGTAQSTARNRQWAALAAFGEAARLGAPIDASALVGARIPRPDPAVSARPLTDAEAERVRVYADAGLVASRRSLLVEFSYAGGTATEVAGVRMRDVDADAGTVVFTGAAARVGRLDAWGVETVRRFLRNHPAVAGGDLLCVTAGSDVSRGAHSVTVRLGQVLDDAGLSGRPGVTARSIRLTGARRVLEADGIEAAARFLGSPSLDSTAAALGHMWRAGDGL